MNKLNFRTRAKCIHKIFGQVECIDYFTCKKNAQENAKEISCVHDTIGVIYLERWNSKKWEVLETTHF